MGSNDKDKYFMDSSDELGRQRINHRMIKGASNGQLVFAPVDWSVLPKEVLDVAGADGFLMHNLQEIYSPKDPSAIKGVVTDIVARYFPEKAPAGIQFVHQDTTKPWPKEWENRFDLVHQRVGFAAATHDAAEATKTFFRMTKPGGWVQISEMIIAAPFDAGPGSRDFFALLAGVLEASGQDAQFYKKLRQWVEDAGFSDVEEKIIYPELGKENANPELREATVQSSLATVNGLIGFANSESDSEVNTTASESLIIQSIRSEARVSEEH